MKKIKFILAAFAVAMISLNAFAQEDNNRDANGYVVRGPYLTNGAGSNWFVGVGGGFTTSFGEGVKPFAEFAPKNNWAAEAFIGKWFTPSVGARIGYKGVMNNFGYDTDLYTSNFVGSGELVRFGYGHADLMWNFSNTLGGYKETRFWDIIPYAGAGVYGINNGYTDNKFAVSAGVYNELRLSRVVNLYIDLSVLGTENVVGLRNVETGAALVTNDTPIYRRPTYTPTATVGITFNLGRKKNFDRYSSVAPVAVPFTIEQYNDLYKRVGALEKENNDLKDKLIEAQNKPVETKEVVVEKTRVLVGSNIITFPIGSCVLSDTERAKVDEFAKSVDKGTLIQVVGSADTKTGSETRNYALAKNRANVVKNELIKNGVAEERITTSSRLDATDNVRTSRSAIITLTVE